MAAGPISVLIADDDPRVREVLCNLLDAAEGIELAGAAPEAASAIELADRTRPSVALVDFDMPGGGAETVRGILERSPRTRVVALSGFADHETTMAMLRAGAESYLVKGSQPEEIVAAVQRAARGESIFAAEVAGEVVGELAAHLERSQRERERDQALRARIRDVIDARRLRLVFQPIVDLGTDEAIGLEALARFDAPPEQGPEAWFADAEAAGLRLELELAAAEAAAAAFSAHQCPGFLAVNASPDALPGLVPLAAELRDRLVVEVTEHAAVDDYETIGTSLAALRESGARLAVDDAGAGYASLRHVLELGPEIVKLDLTLTRDIDRDSRRRAVARGLAAAADELGSTIVAEGVETAAELETLVGLGVRFGQGYLLGRPAPLAT